jgi:molecular chaperone DnaJ
VADRDYYAVLGVPRTASAEEIKRAYRRLARTHHPDVNPGDPNAEERFKQIAEAYAVLSDPAKRQRYDQFGAAGVAGAAQGGSPFGAEGPFGGVDFDLGGGLGDLFDLFGMGGRAAGRGLRPQAGEDLEMALEIDLLEVLRGARREIRVQRAQVCPACGGKGGRGGEGPVACPTCRGRGQVQQVRQTPLGRFVTSMPCVQCGGAGQVLRQPCGECSGQGRVGGTATLTVTVPPGMANGHRLRVPGEGHAGVRGGPAGDLYLRIREKPNQRFMRAGDDLVTDLSVGLAQATLGARLKVTTLEGQVEEVHVPAGTGHGKEFVLRGLGLPSVRGRSRGDLRVKVHLEVPQRLTPEQRDLWLKLAHASGEEVDADVPFLRKVRDSLRGG